MARGIGALDAAERALDRLDAVAATLGGVIVFLVMIIVVVDVIMRYVFNSPLSWSYDIISMYLMLGAFYLALSETLRRNHHVAVDLFYQRFSVKTKLVWRLITWLLAGLFFALVFVLTLKGAWSRWEGGDVVAGSIPWPTWISSALAAFGSLVITLRLFLDCAFVAIALATGRPELAAPAGLAGTIEPENL